MNVVNVLIVGLLILGIVLCGLAARGIGAPRWHLGWAGIAAGLLAALVAYLNL